MGRRLLAVVFLAALGARAYALDGQIAIHDPSTVVVCDGKFYTYGTGGTPLVSDDGWTWRAGTRPTRTGLAPDVIHIGDRYYMYIAANIGGLPRAQITMISNKTLDPNSPDYNWEDGGIVCSTDGVEDCNGIDPGAFLDPTDGKLWLSYGSYFGFIRIVQLDPKTGKRIDLNDKPIDISINMEATDIIYHDGYYYLFGTRGSCCRGTDSRYNIRVGRAKRVSGPYVDDEGVELIQGGGKLFCGSGGRAIGPGHFGLLEVDGVQKFSIHYEADLDRGGASVLDIRPLLWKDGWPVAGENAKAGTYEIESVRMGTALEMAVEGVPVGGGGRGRGARGGRGGGAPADGAAAPAAPAAPPVAAAAPADAAPAARGGGRGGRGGGGAPMPAQDAAAVSANWPTGNVGVRMANYLLQAQQKWEITPVANAGGYPGSPYFKITVAGTDRALAATAEGELTAVASFSGATEQLWRIDGREDGTFRIMPKGVPNAKEPLVLTAIGNSTVTLEKFDSKSNKQRWNLKAP